MRTGLAAAAFLCAALCILSAPLTGQDGSKNTLLARPSSSGKTSAKTSGGRGIFDIATAPTSGKSANSGSGAGSGKNTTASPFGTTSPGTTRNSSTRRWKTTSKLADCIREKTVPSNTNFSFSGTITRIENDGRYTILFMFDSVETVAENGARGDVPVSFTVVMDTEAAAKASLKVNGKKSFVADSNYVYFVWDDAGCTVRVVDNSLTEPDPAPASSGKR